MGENENTAPAEEKKPEPEKKPPEQTHDETTAAEKPELTGVAAIVEAVKGEAAKPEQAGEVKAEPPKPGLFFPDIRKIQEKKNAGVGRKPDLHPPAKSATPDTAATPAETVEEPTEPIDVQRPPPPKAPADVRRAPAQPSSKKKRPSKSVDIGGDYIVGGLFITSKPKEPASYAFTVGHLNEHDKEVILFMGKYLTGMNYIPENNPLLVAKFALNFLYNGVKEELGLKEAHQ